MAHKIKVKTNGSNSKHYAYRAKSAAEVGLSGRSPSAQGGGGGGGKHLAWDYPEHASKLTPPFVCGKADGCTAHQASLA